MDYIKEIKELKRKKNAIILTHCYQNIEIDEISDFVSDGSPDRRIDTKVILTRIKEAGTCRYLYVNAKQSRLTVSTIHRSKGREYDSVIILDELLQDETKDLEEHRVKYVALSRARSSIFRSSMKKLFFRTLEDRRCFSVGTVFKNNNKYLKNFEVGLKDDLNVDYFASADALQEWIRENADELVGKEVYLSRQGRPVREAPDKAPFPDGMRSFWDPSASPRISSYSLRNL